MFSRAKQGLLVINRQAKSGSEQEKKVARNVVSSLAITLQDLSVDFRKAQSSYLKSKRRGGGEGREGEERGGRRGGGGEEGERI